MSCCGPFHVFFILITSKTPRWTSHPHVHPAFPKKRPLSSQRGMPCRVSNASKSRNLAIGANTETARETARRKTARPVVGADRRRFLEADGGKQVKGRSGGKSMSAKEVSAIMPPCLHGQGKTRWFFLVFDRAKVLRPVGQVHRTGPLFLPCGEGKQPGFRSSIVQSHYTPLCYW